MPAPALAQTGEPQVKHATYYDPERSTAASCVAVGVTTGASTTVFMTGHAVAPGGVSTRCSLVQGGRVVASSQKALPGSTAPTAGTATVAAAPWTVCIELWIAFLDGHEMKYQGCA
jgi:hypothetical protein